MLAQRGIAEAMARSGDIAGALATARSIDASEPGPVGGRDEIPDALAGMAVEQAKAGQPEAAGALLGYRPDCCVFML